MLINLDQLRNVYIYKKVIEKLNPFNLEHLFLCIRLLFTMKQFYMMGLSIYLRTFIACKNNINKLESYNILIFKG